MRRSNKKRASAIHDPYIKFKAWLVENGKTYADVADLLSINVATVSSKINGQSDFTLSEVMCMCKEWCLDKSIFFVSAVA